MQDDGSYEQAGAHRNAVAPEIEHLSAQEAEDQRRSGLERNPSGDRVAEQGGGLEHDADD